MQEMNSLEKQLQSWMPRRPSARIARRLFAKAAPAHVFLRRTDVWNWLTPAAACAMTLMVATHGPSRHLPRLSVPDNASFFATLVFNAATSNGPQTFVLGKMDENVEWNFWPHPLATPTAGRAGPHFSLNDVMPTNR